MRAGLLLALIIALLDACPVSAQVPPETLLVRGGRARTDTNFQLAIALFDSALATPSISDRLLASGLFQAAVARFQYGRSILQRVQGPSSCPARPRGAQLLMESDSLLRRLDAIPRTCNDCGNHQLKQAITQELARVRRLCH
jgi:hypothetical protein